MFDQLFFRSDALTRQLSAPLVDERHQYLAQCAAQGMSKCTLRMKARLLLSIAEYLRLAERPNDTISPPEIKKAASRWSRHNWPSSESSHARRSREHFMAQAAEWLTFLNRLQTAPKPVTVYDQMLAEFRSFMEEDRGLSPATVKGCCSSVRPFVIPLLDGRRSLEAISVSDVDSLLAQKVNEEHYARVSVRDYASSLRSFFRHAEMRGWCPVGIAASIMAPRVFKQETLPSGPTWDIVQEIVDPTAGDHPIAIRDHAILMLLAIYGVRSREVARLLLAKRAPRPTITYLEKSEMDALLNAPDQSTHQGRRDHALLLFLYNTGVRADEAAQVKIVDLLLAHSSRDHSLVQVRGKGK